jgi:hypothetical protein
LERASTKPAGEKRPWLQPGRKRLHPWIGTLLDETSNLDQFGA